MSSLAWIELHISRRPHFQNVKNAMLNDQSRKAKKHPFVAENVIFIYRTQQGLQICFSNSQVTQFSFVMQHSSLSRRHGRKLCRLLN